MTDPIIKAEQISMKGEDLPKKSWWRFAQAIYVLAASIIFVMIFVVTIAVVAETNTLSENESTVLCDNGKSFNVGKFSRYLGVYQITSQNLNDSRFTDTSTDAKIKMFCTALGRDEDPFLYPVSVFSISYDELRDISSRSLSKRGEINTYTIQEVRDYGGVGKAVGLGFLALIVEAFIFMIIRSVARYTLIGKVF